MTYHEVDTSFQFWSPPRKHANGHYYTNNHQDLRPEDETQDALLCSIIKVNGCGHIGDNDGCGDKDYVHKQEKNGCDKIAKMISDNGGNVREVLRKGVVVEKVVLDDFVVQEVDKKFTDISVKNHKKMDKSSEERIVDDTKIVVHTDIKKKQKRKEKKESKVDLAKVHKGTKGKNTTDINSIKINIDKQHTSNSTIPFCPTKAHNSPTLTQDNTTLSDNAKLLILPDLESTLDYLLRNKAVSHQECNYIVKGEEGAEDSLDENTEPSPNLHKTTQQVCTKPYLQQERSKRLLQIIDSRPSIRPLFTNALRMIGQFELANLCDLTPRIHPLSGSGES